MEDLKDIKWLGHASFSFVDTQGNRIYYVDPFDLKAKVLDKADLIFITHAHPDHFSQKDIDQIIKADTIVVAPPDILEQINIEDNLKLSVSPNNTYSIKNFHFQTVPAYNIHPDKIKFHPKENNWVGYIFNINDKKIYHAGDTDFIEEMKDFSKLNLDIAMLPIGGGYTMDYKEAAEAANSIKAKVTIPMHYKRLLADKYKQVEQEFKNLVTHSKVEILEEVS